jgi:SM-20-related protein
LSRSTQVMNNQFDQLIDSYLDNNIGIDTGFLHEALSNGLQQNILQLQRDELMTAAGIGNEETKDPTQKTRGDKIYWMDKSHANIYEQEFLTLAEDFIDHLNRTCYTGINAYEFHYAVYEEGSFYKRHRDQFQNDSNRKYSLINYLNQDWLEEDGGQLWVYNSDAVQKIMPQAQTAVFFKSDEMEHEVTKANRSRMSISGWLKRV